MVEKKFPRFCGCFGNGKSERNENGTDQNDAYEAAPQTRAPIASFHSTQDNSDPNEPSSSTIESSNNNKKHFLGLSWPKLKDRKLPQIPPKSVTFSRVQDIPHIDDPIPTYESIDVNDATYSKMDDRRNYDYPVFPHRRKKNLEENMYASASQTYSLGGSEDPYSSIASVRGANDDASVGYARVNEEQLRSNRQKPSTSSMNVDDLYAKVNRKTVQEQRIQNGLLPSNHLSNGFRNLQQIQPSTSGNFAPEPEESIYQMDESGSGSITSSGSFNPSYRYLTVRETLGVIRERMRRRNEEYNNYSTENNTSAKEHYYSTISNDYDSVRNDPEAPSTSTSSTRPNNPSSSNRNSLVMSELKINTSNPTGQFRPPPAPTSPIPQLPSQPPSAVSLNHNCSLASSSLVTNTASFTATNLSNNAPNLSASSVHSQLPPLFPVTPRIIWPPQRSDNNDDEEDDLNEIRMSYSTTMTSRPIVISMANVLRKHESSPNIKYMKSIGTSTDDLIDSPKPKKSKIPRLVNNQRIYSKFDHRLMSRSHEENQTLKKSLKRPPSLGFIPVGNDYVSLIDFSRKNERGWPFDRTL